MLQNGIAMSDFQGCGSIFGKIQLILVIFSATSDSGLWLSGSSITGASTSVCGGHKIFRTGFA